jgi:hypothetical protein
VYLAVYGQPRSGCEPAADSKFRCGRLLPLPGGNYTFFLKFFLENEIVLDNLKFFAPIFSNFDCIFLENAISFFYLKGRFQITIYASKKYF